MAASAALVGIMAASVVASLAWNYGGSNSCESSHECSGHIAGCKRGSRDTPQVIGA